jgi:hypothetical protein
VVGTLAEKAKTPALVGTAAAGLAGGIAFGARMLSRPKRTRAPMGAVKSLAHEAQGVGKEIAKTGFRVGVGDVNMEVSTGRKGRRDSPLEVLLHGLTNRRAKRD